MSLQHRVHLRLLRNGRFITTKLLFYGALPACCAERVQAVQDVPLWTAGSHRAEASVHLELTDRCGKRICLFLQRAGRGS